jgi:hypothetical protein
MCALEKGDAAYADWLVIFGTEHKSPCAVGRRILKKKGVLSWEDRLPHYSDRAQISIVEGMEGFWKEEQPSWLCLLCRFGGQQNTQHALDAWLFFFGKREKGGWG